MIASTFETDTFTTPFSVALRGGYTLSDIVPPGLTIVFMPVPVGEVVIDSQVNILDAAALAFSYGTELGDEVHNAYADFNIDARVDILDAAAPVFNYGRTF